MTFPFNPTDIEVTRGCGFSSENSDSNSVNDYGGLKFGGAKSDELSMSFILDTSEPDVMSAKYATQMMMPIIMSTPSMAPAKTAKAIPYFGGNVNADSVTSILDVINMMTKLSEDDRKKKKKDATDIVLNIQLNNKFADVLVDSAVSDSASIYADEMSELDDVSESITQEALTGIKSSEIDPDEYDLIAEPIRVRILDTGNPDTESRIVGYIIEKYVVNEETYELDKVKDIIIENPVSTRMIDTEVMYGKTYVYQIRTIAQVDFQAPSEDESDILSSTMLISSKPSGRALVECIETVPPAEPADFKPVWNYSTNNLNLMWNFPVNPQRDIKKFQVLNPL